MRIHRRPSHGFTLLELLIVISIIAILSVLGFAVFRSSVEYGKRVKAQQQVQAIWAAAQEYFQELKVYPPDTFTYEPGDLPPDGLSASGQKFAIHRYLGMKITDKKSGLQFGPYLRNLNEQNLTGEVTQVDGMSCQLYCDPWGKPFELDCTHFTRDPKTRAVTISKPYPDGTPEDQMTEDVKAWSAGPDGKRTDAAPFYPLEKNTDDKDNIMSWTKGGK